jgi:hypothetical protein
MTRMPQVTARELVQFLKAQGFVEDRQSGSHLPCGMKSATSPSPSPPTPAAILVVVSPFAF